MLWSRRTSSERLLGVNLSPGCVVSSGPNAAASARTYLSRCIRVIGFRLLHQPCIFKNIQIMKEL
jgi:hypothetical protein